MKNLILTLALLAALGVITNAFQTVPPPSRLPLGLRLSSGRAKLSRQKPSFVLSAIEERDDKGPSQDQPRGNRAYRLRRRLRRLVSKLSLRKKMVAAVMFGAATAGLWNAATPQRADASAPVMAVPKAQRATPEKEALLNQERKMAAQQQAEMQMVTQKASAIEREQGIEARVKFEKEYKAQKEKEAQEKAEGLEQLKRDLLDQGIDPFVDLEGQRQVILYEKGVDLGQVPGTLMYLEQQIQTGRTPQKSNAYKQAPNRRVIKAMVQDMKNKGIDPLAYFEAHSDKAQDILAMPPVAAAQMAAQYEANLEQYGQVNVPKEGEMSVLEKRKLAGGDKKQEAEAKKKAKEEQKRAKAEAKAKAAAEKKRAKEEKKAAKEAAKKEKEASKAAAAAAAAAATVASGTSSSALSATAAAIDSVSLDTPPSDEADIVDQSSETEVVESEVQAAVVETPTKSSNKVNIGGKEIGIIPLAGLVIVAAGGGTYGFRMYQEKAAVAEEERQRQFRILMGEESGPSSAPALEVVDTDDDLDFEPSPKVEEPTTKPSPVPQAPAKKKKRRGFFGKKNKNNRETDLTVLVSAGAKAPQFATLLAKILTYGAPGRFPSVEALPGEMPFEEFNLEDAQQQLLDARREAGIAVEDSAEIFANVVNCMLIDMVDLASSTLKSKDDKMTVEGIKVVVDFMNHAASLFESVAEDVVIEPVTYGGDLSRGKLEQMYAAYAGSGMMDMSALMGGGDGGNDDFAAGVGLLQDVFDISDKKAEGLTMKIARKSMMEMMKDGKGMEEMMKQFGGEEGLAGMAGMEGMEGLMGGDPGDIDPEQLKMMLQSLKDMKDSGAFGPEDLKEVRQQFKEAYGSSIDEVMKEGGSGEDEELLELLKGILE